MTDWHLGCLRMTRDAAAQFGAEFEPGRLAHHQRLREPVGRMSPAPRR